MKTLIISDIHGSSFYLSKIMDIYEIEKPERILILGDILYHGPRNDLPKGYAPKEVIAMLNPLKDKIIAVRGNCEAEVDQMVLDFPCMDDHRILDFDGLKVYVTHGHHHNIQSLNTDEAFDVLLHGHTHVPVFENQGSYTYINPGSISIPKNDSVPSFILYENRIFDFRNLNNESYRRESL